MASDSHAHAQKIIMRKNNVTGKSYREFVVTASGVRAVTTTVQNIICLQAELVRCMRCIDAKLVAEPARVLTRLGVSTRMLRSLNTLSRAGLASAWASMQAGVWLVQELMLRKAMEPGSGSGDDDGDDDGGGDGQAALTIGGVLNAMAELREAMPTPFPDDLPNADLVWFGEVVRAFAHPDGSGASRRFKLRISAVAMHVVTSALSAAAPHALAPDVARGLAVSLRSIVLGGADVMGAIKEHGGRVGIARIQTIGTWTALVRLGLAQFVLHRAHARGLLASPDANANTSIVAGALGAASLSAYLVAHPQEAPAHDVEPWIASRICKRADLLVGRCGQDPQFAARMFRRFKEADGAAGGGGGADRPRYEEEAKKKEDDSADRPTVGELLGRIFVECPICMVDRVPLFRLDCCPADVDALLAGKPVHVMCADCWRDLRSDPKKCPNCDEVCALMT